MLDETIKLFLNYRLKLKKLKKKEYEERFDAFMNGNKSVINTVLMYVKGRDDREAAAGEVASIIIENLYGEFGKWGRLSGGVRSDLSLYMIYFIFPAFIKTEDENAEIICDAIRDEWRSRTKNYSYDYTTYEELHDSFQEKLFGVF